MESKAQENGNLADPDSAELQDELSQYREAVQQLSADKERLVTLDEYRRQHIATLERELERLRGEARSMEEAT